tara:strand:+ start:423 stop:1262 length:840 start_codon:yes stop_codon:yes gene_type:complete
MIINTFISDGGPIPEYTNVCLRQARKTNPDEDIRFICVDNQEVFDELDIKWIPQGSIDSDLLKEFNDCCWFKRHGTPQTTHPSPELFWHRTAERIYYLEAYISENNLCDVFHFENDVLLYGSLDLVPTCDMVMVLPMSRNKSTFAFTYVPNPQQLHEVCQFFNWLLSNHNEETLMRHVQDHVSEMSLLHIALKKQLVSALPTLPTQNDKIVFDPGSYGQFLGGTNNGHSSGFTDSQHFIGEAINNGDLNVVFDGVPSVNGVKIFNLHIHSKNLKEFVSV